MRKTEMKRIILTTALTAALLCACAKNTESPEGPDTPPSSQLPEPPIEMNANNTFAVDYFTDLKDKDSYFARRDVSIAKNHILGAEGKKAVIFFFDRMDFTVGDSNPFMKICRDNNIWPYFVQQEPTGMQVTKGCGIITKTAIADFDGIYDSDVFLGGADIHIQTGIPGRTTIYTSRIDKMAQLDEIFIKKSVKLSENAVIIGRVKNGLEKELEQKRDLDIRKSQKRIEGYERQIKILKNELEHLGFFAFGEKSEKKKEINTLERNITDENKKIAEAKEKFEAAKKMIPVNVGKYAKNIDLDKSGILLPKEPKIPKLSNEALSEAIYSFLCLNKGAYFTVSEITEKLEVENSFQFSDCLRRLYISGKIRRFVERRKVYYIVE